MASKDQRVIRSEDVLAQKTDLCISNAIVKTGIGFGTGVVLSVLLFRRRSFPVWLSTGFGLGSSYTDCQRSFNPLSVPGVRVVPANQSPSDVPQSSFEKLQQRAGELVGSSREKVEEKKSEYLPQVKKGLEEIKEKGQEVVGKVEDKFLIRSPNETPTSATKSQDCFSCRLTGTLALGGLGGYSLLEAYRLMNPTSTSSTSKPPTSTSSVASTISKVSNSSSLTSDSNVQRNVNEINKKLLRTVGGKSGSKLHATVLVLFGIGCLTGAGVRWTN